MLMNRYVLQYKYGKEISRVSGDYYLVYDFHDDFFLIQNAKLL